MGKRYRRNRHTPATKTFRVIEGGGKIVSEAEKPANLTTRNIAPSLDYDADLEFIEAAKPKLQHFDFMADQQDGKPWDVQATLFEVSRDGKSYRLNRISNKETLRQRIIEAETYWTNLEDHNQVPRLGKLREAVHPERDLALDAEGERLLESRLKEDYGFEYGGNGLGGGGGQYGSAYQGTAMPAYGSGLDVNAEYIPLMGGPYSKALYQYAYLDMHRKAFEAYNHNPIAHQLVELQTSFVLGRGIDHTCTNDEAEAIWAEFCTRTHFYEDLENIANDLWWQGETMLEFYDNVPSKGLTDYRMIDPSTVWDIITDPEDIQKVFYYHQQYSCLHGDTKVALTDGSSPTVRELAARAEAGESFEVYAYDLATKRIVPGPGATAFVQGRKRCVEVELDNGEKIIASWDHPFLTRQGEYVLAEDMQPGQSLMPLYRRQGYEEVWQPETGWIQTHRSFAESLGLDMSKGRHIDHIDGVKTNNTSANLQSLTRSEHAVKTYAQIGTTARMLEGYAKAGRHREVSLAERERRAARMRLRFAVEGEREKAAERARKQWAERTPEQRAEVGRAIVAGRGQSYYADLAQMSVVNHKVVAVRPAGEHVVYDLTVPDYHNFALTAGVFTHNTTYQMYTKGNIETMRYVWRDIPADHVLHVKLNASKYEKRGRSDYFSILGWLKRLKDLMNARVVKGQLEAAFVWDVTVNSGDADIQNTMLNLPDPYKAGSTFVHNKNLELKAVTGEVKGGDAAPDIDALLNLIAVGFGIPKEFIGQSAKGAKAGALTATEPGVKRFERRQRLIENLCYMVANRVFQNAVKAKQLDIDTALKDARSVTKLGRLQDSMPHRDDAQADMEQQQQDANDKAEQVNDQQNKMAMQAHKVGMTMMVQDQAHRHDIEKTALNQQHKQAMAGLNKPGAKTQIAVGVGGTQGPLGAATGAPGGGMGQPPGQGASGAPGAPGAPQQGAPQQGGQQGSMPQGQPVREAATPDKGTVAGKGGKSDEIDPGPMPDAPPQGGGTADSPIMFGKNGAGAGAQADGDESDDSNNNIDKPLNEAQTKRIKAIKDSEEYAREFLEFIFPSIAQEDRSAKLKDLALAEAMQWLPKSWAAKIAAKELNITTYSFEDAWAQIVEETAMGMSIAHVYTQDNEHVPQTTIAQDSQAEIAAKQPIAPQNQQVNVPVPPAVAGDKLMPAQGKGPGGGGPPGGGGTTNPSAAPGKSPNSGSTKTNKFSGPDPAHTDPTQASHGYSAAANNPMGSEGAAKARESVQQAVKNRMLREALGPALNNVKALTERILETDSEIKELLGDK